MSNAPARLGSEWACLAVLAGAVSIGGGGCFPPALPQADIDGDGDVPTEVATDTDGLAETADGVDTDAVDTTDMIELIDMVDTIDTIDGDGSDVDAGHNATRRCVGVDQPRGLGRGELERGSGGERLSRRAVHDAMWRHVV